MELAAGLARIGSAGVVLLLMLTTGLAGCTSEPPKSWPEAYSLVPYLPAPYILLPESDMRFKGMTYVFGIDENPGFISLNRSKLRPHLLEMYAAVGGTPGGDDILVSVAYRWDSAANATANLAENSQMECQNDARGVARVLQQDVYVVWLIAVSKSDVTEAQRDDLDAIVASMRENTGAIFATCPTLPDDR